MRTLKIGIILYIISIITVSLSAAGERTGELSSKKASIRVIPVEGTVNPSMAYFIKRSVEKGIIEGVSIFILDMNTFGGRVDSALDISDTLTDVPENVTVFAYVSQKAISAGALIALSTKGIVMAPNTLMGDCAPISYSTDGPQMLGEKFQSPLRAKFRSLARKNGYPVDLAASMVTAEMEVFKVTIKNRGEMSILYVDAAGLDNLKNSENQTIDSVEVAVKEGELLTMDEAEAHEMGFSRFTAGTIEEMVERLDLYHYGIERIKASWSEKMVGIIDAISPFLLIVGFACIYLEFKTAGFTGLGLLGVLLIGLVFGSQYAAGLADYSEIILLTVGLLLMAAEVFIIPGFGITGILGILFILAGMVLSFQGFVIPKPEAPWQYDIFITNVFKVLGSLTGAFVLSYLVLEYGLSRIRSKHSPYLFADLSDAKVSYEKDAILSPGDVGVVVKPLRPSGKACFGSKIHDVISDGDFAEIGDKVIVLNIHSNRIEVVKL